MRKNRRAALCRAEGGLPDAFICANDILAESVRYVLEEYGIKTPEDVILTGFDHSEEGKLFFAGRRYKTKGIMKKGKIR